MIRVPIKLVIQESRANLASNTGLWIVGSVLRHSRIRQRSDAVKLVHSRDPQLSHGEILVTMIGLLTQGKTNFEDVEPFRKQPQFPPSLNLSACPSSATLRQRLELTQGQFDVLLKEESAALLVKLAPKLTGCREGNREWIPVDVDVSVFDNSKSHKEGVSRTYMGLDGFSPIFAYLGREGYALNADLREGKQHCQNGTPEFLRETLALARRITKKPLLVRLDGGNDSADNQTILDGSENVSYICKRNPRREDQVAWLELAEAEGQVTESESWRKRTVGSTLRRVPGLENPQRIVYEVIEIFKDRHGQQLLLPMLEINTYWTNLDISPATVIQWYHAHGESEQYHSEYKSDLGLERFPSGRFESNRLILLLAMVAFNVLRLCGQLSLEEEQNQKGLKLNWRKEKVVRRRLRSVMQDLMFLASRLKKSGRRTILDFGRYCPYATVFSRLYRRLTNPQESWGLSVTA